MAAIMLSSPHQREKTPLALDEDDRGWHPAKWLVLLARQSESDGMKSKLD
jgi:hypothetical protein